MSIRALIRLLTLAPVCAMLSIPLWNVAGPWLLLAGPGLFLSTLGYLGLMRSRAPLSRWQLRYYLPTHPSRACETEIDPQDSKLSLDRLEDILNYLVARSGYLVLEGCADGLFLELPEAFDRYVEAQLPRALPEAKLTRGSSAKNRSAGKTFYLSVGSPHREALRWATKQDGRHVRAHIHHGPTATVLAYTDGSRPPGRWIRIPVSRPLVGFYHRLPVWDELSAGFQLSQLVPETRNAASYSSRSRLLALSLPDAYRPPNGGRVLGRSADGRPLIVSRTSPLFTVGASASFLMRQVADDLQAAALTVVVSPDRHFLDRARHEFGPGADVQRLDPQNSQASARLGIVPAGEWGRHSPDVVASLLETFVQDVGLDVHLPSIQRFARRLIQALIGFSRQVGRDLAFTDLYAVSQSTRALQAFLLDLLQLEPEVDARTSEAARALLQQMSGDEGYVQAVTILSALRTALAPMRAGAMHALSQGPYFGIQRSPAGKGRLLLAAMGSADFADHDRLLSAMLDLTLGRILAAHSDGLRVALHLYNPHCYRRDAGRRWIEVARRDPRLSLLVNVQDPAAYDRVPTGNGEPELFFRFSESLASGLMQSASLPIAASELQELPLGVAIARLGSVVAALQVEEP